MPESKFRVFPQQDQPPADFPFHKCLSKVLGVFSINLVICGMKIIHKVGPNLSNKIIRWKILNFDLGVRGK